MQRRLFVCRSGLGWPEAGRTGALCILWKSPPAVTPVARDDMDKPSRERSQVIAGPIQLLPAGGTCQNWYQASPMMSRVSQIGLSA